MIPAATTMSYLRTVRGQLTLLGALYASSAVLSLAVVSLRAAWFERTVLEKFPSSNDVPAVARGRALARDVAEGRRPGADVADLSDAELLTVYGSWIDAPERDGRGLLAAALWEHQGERLPARVRRTLVAGSRGQRLRALSLLGTIPNRTFVSEARRLCRFALERAERRHETQVADHAAAILRRLASDPSSEGVH